MARRLSGNRLIIASHNPGKVAEIDDLVRPYGIAAVPAATLDLPEPEETGTSFAENAVLKARAAALATATPALADDSGLVVPALGGAPGIRSARWAGPAKDFRAAMEKIERKLDDAPDRRAAFVCALALAWPDGGADVFEGEVQGDLVWPPRGDRGFGYDPMFVPDGHRETFGEMAPEAKHRISHRAAAFRRFVAACLDGGQ